MSQQRVEISPELTAVSLTYTNKTFIAEEILPKVPVGTRSFEYYEYDKNNYFHLPETRIGEKGKANKVEFRGKKKSASVEDHALEEDIPVSKIKEAQNSQRHINYETKAVNQLTRLLKTRKEITVSNILSNVNSYGGNSGNVKTLTNAEKINNDTANAVKIIQTAADSLLYKPNILVTSRLGLSALRMNPFIVDACGAASKKAGIVSIEAVKDLFGFEKILAGESVINTANKGQAANMHPCWANNIALLHIDKDADADEGVTFGFEAVYEDIQIGKYHNSELGTQGCDVVKAFYSSVYLNICADCGFLLKDILA